MSAHTARSAMLHGLVAVVVYATLPGSTMGQSEAGSEDPAPTHYFYYDQPKPMTLDPSRLAVRLVTVCADFLARAVPSVRANARSVIHNNAAIPLDSDYLKGVLA